jgi:CRP-like cAMP-binding protein
MAFEPDSAQLLSRLPTHLTTHLFAGANPVKLAADQALFLAGDPGDSCYRVELGLLKVTMVSRSGIERILSFIGRGGIVGELSIIDGLPRSASVVAVRDTALSRRPTWRSLLGASCRCEVALPSRCSNWRIILDEMSDRIASSLSTKSGRATSRPWPELLAKT